MNGAVLSYTGNLRTNANVIGCGSGCTLGVANTDEEYAQWAAVTVDFTLVNPAMVRLVTFSYGGGTNGSSASVAPGGFEPYLSLFDGAGTFLMSTNALDPNGETCPAGAGTFGGNCFDVALNPGTLAAGTYRVALTAYSNLSFAENLGIGTLADGFTGLGNLAPGLDLHYAFDIQITDSGGAVPEPSSFLLLGTGLALAAWRAGRSRCQRKPL